MKLKYIKSGLAVLLATIIGLIGCSPATQLSRETILQQNSSIAKLENSLKAADQKGVTYLAPEGFNTAVNLLEESIEQAKDQDPTMANHTAEQGLIKLMQAEKDAANSRYIMEEVLNIRERAIKAGSI